MDKELRKRFEEAAKIHSKCGNTCAIKDIIGRKTCKRFCTEYGYKEAIQQAKEWIQKNVPIIHTEEGDYVRVKNVSMNKYLADFEAEMNKLWEEN